MATAVIAVSKCLPLSQLQLLLSQLHYCNSHCSYYCHCRYQWRSQKYFVMEVAWVLARNRVLSINSGQFLESDMHFEVFYDYWLLTFVCFGYLGVEGVLPENLLE